MENRLYSRKGEKRIFFYSDEAAIAALADAQRTTLVLVTRPQQSARSNKDRGLALVFRRAETGPE